MAAKRYLYPGHRAIREGRRGQRKAWVRRWQAELHRRGYKVSADGTWDPRTKAATIRFQRRHDLKADGVPGVRTWAAAFGVRSVRKHGPFGGRWPWLDLAPGVSYANERLSAPMNLIGAILHLKHGKTLRCISGRRTMAQQWYLYNGWVNRRPGFNLAAYPSANAPHIRDGGSAYDCGTVDRHGTYRRFFDDGDARRLAARFDIHQRVTSEAWHASR